MRTAPSFFSDIRFTSWSMVSTLPRMVWSPIRLIEETLHPWSFQKGACLKTSKIKLFILLVACVLWNVSSSGDYRKDKNLFEEDRCIRDMKCAHDKLKSTISRQTLGQTCLLWTMQDTKFQVVQFRISFLTSLVETIFTWTRVLKCLFLTKLRKI